LRENGLAGMSGETAAGVEIGSQGADEIGFISRSLPVMP
jgi:hypothetical protein